MKYIKVWSSFFKVCVNSSARMSCLDTKIYARENKKIEWLIWNGSFIFFRLTFYLKFRIMCVPCVYKLSFAGLCFDMYNWKVGPDWEACCVNTALHMNLHCCRKMKWCGMNGELNQSHGFLCSIHRFARTIKLQTLKVFWKKLSLASGRYVLHVVLLLLHSFSCKLFLYEIIAFFTFYIRVIIDHLWGVFYKRRPDSTTSTYHAYII